MQEDISELPTLNMLEPEPTLAVCMQEDISELPTLNMLEPEPTLEMLIALGKDNSSIALGKDNSSSVNKKSESAQMHTVRSLLWSEKSSYSTAK